MTLGRRATVYAGAHERLLSPGVCEAGSREPPKPRLLDRMREALRLRRYSRRTEEAYVAWARRYILFHGKRHPEALGAPEVTGFLTSLAVEGRVAASTQNQALSALLFLYRDVLEIDLPWLDGIVRARRPERLPVVLTRDEVRAVLQQLEGVPRLMACLLYGAGLRVLECCRLRIQDVDLATNQVLVRGGKGDKDRMTMLPAMAKADLVRHLAGVRTQHQEDLAAGPAGWSCPWRWPGSTRTPAASGSGSGSFPRPVHIPIGAPGSAGGITCTNQSSSGPSSRRSGGPTSPSGPARTPCGTPSRPTCSRTATISAPSRSCWATGT